MFQTWWEINRQNVRKFIDTLSGAAAGWLASQGEWGAMAVPGLVLVVNYAWFWFDNKTKVTVKGLEASSVAGTSTLAATVDRMLVKGEKEEEKKK